MARLTGNDRVQVERMMDLLGRCDAIETQLHAFDQRVDAQVNARLETSSTATWPPAKKSWPRAAREAGRASWSDRRAWAAASPRRCSPRSPTSSTTWSSGPTSASSTSSWGLKDQKTQAVTKLDQPEEPRAEGPRRGLPQGAGGRQVSRVRVRCCPGPSRWSSRARSRRPYARDGAAARPPAPAGPRAPAPPDPRAARRDGEGRPALRARW